MRDERVSAHLGLSDTELGQIVEAACGGCSAGYVDGEADVDGATAATRRLVWQATAALVAANNRRLVEQLTELGLLPTRPDSRPALQHGPPWQDESATMQ